MTTMLPGALRSAPRCWFRPRAGAARGYPNKPVKIIVPFAPAGPTDIMARLIAQKLSEKLRQQFYVENIAGAGGNHRHGAGRDAPRRDGYTMLFASSSFVVNPSLYDKVPYDPYKDFMPVTVAAASPNVMAVNPRFSGEDAEGTDRAVQERSRQIHLRLARHRHHAASVGRNVQADLELDSVHVPFAGGGPAIQSIVGGHTPIAFTPCRRPCR